MVPWAIQLSIFGADFNGYIIDESCASKSAMKGNEACARKCIRGGSPAVLLSEGDKVYKLDDQAKVSEHAGHKVKVPYWRGKGNQVDAFVVGATPGE